MPTHGGFFVSNIRKWIIKECLESGDADNFFRAVYDVIDDLQFELMENEYDWEEIAQLSEDK